MKPINYYRCYNGCPDSNLQALLNQREDAKNRLKTAFPDAHCTYFPAEQKYLVFIGNKQVGSFQSDIVTACDEAIKILLTA